jgi:phosphopantothenoylcysteine decarboxylase/phosphopantothenate--cysteine ligase
MATAVLDRYLSVDAIVMAAAVADFRPAAVAPSKIKKDAGPPDVVLEPTVDILAELGRRKAAAGAGPVIVGFAAETEQAAERGAEKRARKGADLLVANVVGVADSGFGADTDRAWLAHPGGVDDLGLVTKDALAHLILDHLVKDLVSSPGSPRT